MRYLFIILFPFLLQAQVPLWGTSAFAGFTNGLSEGWRNVQRQDNEHNDLSAKWRNYQLVSRTATVAIGVELYAFSDNLLDGAKKSFLSASIYWITSDIGVNIAENQKLFRVSDQSGSLFEPFSYIWVKLLILGVGILINII